MVGRRRHRGGKPASSARALPPPPTALLAAAAVLSMVATVTATLALIGPGGPTTGERETPSGVPTVATRPGSEPDSYPGRPAAGTDGSRIDITAAGSDAALPTGSTYLFVSDRTGSYQVHLATPGGIVRVTDDPSYDHWWPRLSPDGSTVLVTRTPVERSGFRTEGGDETRASLWTMRPDGSGTTERIAAGTFGRLGPARWSPSGDRVVFAATDPVDGVHRIWVADAERFRPRPVTDGDEVVLDPAFSPDGDRLAYVAHPRGYRGDPTATAALEVFVVDLLHRSGEGPLGAGAPTRLTFDQLGDRDPSWSPDGRRLAVATQAHADGDRRPLDRWDLRLVPVDGSGATSALSDDSVNLAPAWEPSGTALVFQRHGSAGDGFTLAKLDLAGGRPFAVGPAEPHNDLHVEPVTGPVAWP